MELPHLNRPVSRDRGISDSFTMRSRAGSEIDPTATRPSTRETDENRSPATLPRAFESMLKTTTETGDIGIFSIKPSRVPQSTGTPRRLLTGNNENGLHKSRQTFQPFGVPNVDDRRRLPSYAGDTTSEVVSMYERASQKAASRVFDEPDYRSYSMTQTTYSAYTLSNHRSYASLRSQQDGNGLLQRPRSPFAYPARLKRPGFRPSSPALTDGGVIDYSRRAEIDRGIYQQKSHNTSSRSSFYTQKRRPPFPLRQEANRSTPSLLSQTSPSRRSPSPGLRQSDGIIAHDWARRNGSTSGNTSPARSTFSFASTVNLYATASGTSNTTTPGKLAPSSPLYYDYTEDFEVDGYNRAAESLGSPPHFSIDKTIPEERRLSAERPPSTEPRVCRLISALRPLSSPTPTPTTPKPLEGVQNHRATTPTEEPVEATQPSIDEISSSVSQFEDLTDKKCAIRLSGLYYGAQELSRHDEGDFGLRPMNSYEASVSQTESEEASSGSMNDGALEGQPIKHPETHFRTELSHRVDHPPHVSSLASSGGLLIDATTTPEAGRSINNLSQVRTFPIPVQLPGATPLPLSTKSGRIGLPEEAGAAPALSSSQGRLRSSSSFESVDTGFTELTNLIKSLEGSNRAKNHDNTQQVLTAPQKSPHLAQAFPGGPMLRNTNINPSQTPPISSFNRSNSKHHANTQVQSPKRIRPHNAGRKMEPSILASYEAFEPSNCSHQMAIRSIPRSGSPMLAPKPISPARQLKLKNSVPQLMKALPALPPERLADTISPADISRTPEDAMLCLFSSVLPGLGATLVQETRHETEKAVSSSETPVAPTESVLRGHKDEPSSKATSTEQPPAADEPTIPDPPPRLKLKMKSFATLRPLSPLSSVPLETENRFPSSTSDPHPHAPGLTNSEKPANPKPPKFRLKITRASDSTSGTVRVNRESGESKAGTGFQLRNHKDLFTSSSGIDSIFRQVSHHLHSRKASAASNTGSEFLGSPVPMLNLTSHLIPQDTSPNTDIVIPQPQSTKSPCPHEARSVFSDDSSHIQGHSSMRGRLFSLRARITVPYVNRIGSQSYDDLTWRDRARRESTVPLAQRSASNLHDSRKSTEARPLRRFAQKIQRHRLKEKVLEWLKEARSAIKSRMKSRSTTESGQVHTRP